MNCNETQAWMLHSETPALPPPPLAEHLRRCDGCRQQHQQLLLVESHLQKTPLSPVPLHAKAALMSRIAAAPVAVSLPIRTSARSLVKQRRRRVRVEYVVGYAAAAAVLLMIGALAGYQYGQRGRQQVAEVGPGELSNVATAAETIPAPPVTPNPQEAPAPAPTPATQANMRPAPAMAAANVDAAPVPAPAALRGAADPDVTVPMPFSANIAANNATSLDGARLLNDDEFLASLIERHAEIASADQAQDRLGRLAALSDVLWTQTVKEAQSGSAGNLDWLGDAYQAMVENDLPALAKTLPADQHDKALSIATSLQERATETGRLLPDASPALAEVLKKLQAGALAGSQRIAKKEKDVPNARPRRGNNNGATDLLPMVVEQTVAVAREDNPLERADHSTTIAEGLAKDILVTSLRGDEQRAGALGGHFGRVLQEGIAVNLQRIDPAKATYLQTRRYQQVVGRTQQTIVFLQQSLEAAPPGARDSLTAAMMQGGMAQLVPPPGPTRRIWIWNPRHFRLPPELLRHLEN